MRSNMTMKRNGNPLPRLAELLETEDEFQSWVIDYAHLHHWTVAHFRPAMVIKKNVAGSIKQESYHSVLCLVSV